MRYSAWGQGVYYGVHIQVPIGDSNVVYKMKLLIWISSEESQHPIYMPLSIFCSYLLVIRHLHSLLLWSAPWTHQTSARNFNRNFLIPHRCRSLEIYNQDLEYRFECFLQKANVSNNIRVRQERTR